MRAYLMYYLLLGALVLYFSIKAALLVWAYYALKAVEIKAKEQKEKEKARIREQIQKRLEERAREQERLARKMMLHMPRPTVRSLTVRQDQIFKDTRQFYP